MPSSSRAKCSPRLLVEVDDDFGVAPGRETVPRRLEACRAAPGSCRSRRSARSRSSRPRCDRLVAAGHVDDAETAVAEHRARLAARRRLREWPALPRRRDHDGRSRCTSAARAPAGCRGRRSRRCRQCRTSRRRAFPAKCCTSRSAIRPAACPSPNGLDVLAMAAYLAGSSSSAAAARTMSSPLVPSQL